MTSEILTTCDCSYRRSKHQKINPNCECFKKFNDPVRRAGKQIIIHTIKCPTCKVNVVKMSKRGKDIPECPECFEKELLGRVVETYWIEFNCIGMK